MSSLTNNSKVKISILDIIAKLRKNINYIKKFGLPSNIARHINSQLIFNDVYIDNSIIISDIKFISYIFYYLKSYKLSQSLVVGYILKVFYEKFYGWGYTEFSKLNKYIR